MSGPTWRVVKPVLVVAACWAFVHNVEDIARYVRMADMSRPRRPDRV